MRVVIIDDEIPAIEEIEYFLETYDVNIVRTYSNSLKALEGIKEDSPDLIFMDIEMPGVNGIELAVKIQNLINHIIIIFVTAYSQYALEAFRVHPIDYILKPIEGQAFQEAMQHAVKQNELIQNQLPQKTEGDDFCELSIHCFGNFDVIKNDMEHMKFSTKKSKELLAYLIYNTDKTIYRDEMFHDLFPNSDVTKAQNNFYVTLYRLRNTLSEFGISRESFLIQENYSISTKDGVCDYLEYCKVIRNKNQITSSSIKNCERILEQYQGEIFKDINTAWVDEVRELMDIQIESLILRMSSYYIERNQYKDVERVLSYLLEINPLSSVGFESLLDLYILADNQNAYCLLYKKYSEYMKEEMGLGIAKEYKDYFAKIVNV